MYACVGGIGIGTLFALCLYSERNGFETGGLVSGQVCGELVILEAPHYSEVGPRDLRVFRVAYDALSNEHLVTDVIFNKGLRIG